MRKSEYLLELKRNLHVLPHDEVERTLDYYREMIDDRIEDGMDEEEAVSQLGTIEENVSRIIADIPMKKILHSKIVFKRNLKKWKKPLIIVLSPIWFVLLVALCCIVLVAFLILYILIPIMYACTLAFAVGTVGGIVFGIVSLTGGLMPEGLFLLGCGIALAGITWLAFFGSVKGMRGIIILTHKMWIGLKSMVIRGGKKNEKD